VAVFSPQFFLRNNFSHHLKRLESDEGGRGSLSEGSFDLFARSSTVPPTMGATLPHRNSILCAHCFNRKVGRGHGGRPKPPPGGPKWTLGSSSLHGPLHIERGLERDRERQRETERASERERVREMRTLGSKAHKRCYQIKIIKMKKGDKN